jgi:hypothetical protein
LWICEIQNRFGVPPPAIVHVDLDGYWAIRQCYGLPEGNTFEADPVYRNGLPQSLQLFKNADITTTFFVTGRDTTIDSKAQLLTQALKDGHSLGNHSSTHPISIIGRNEEEVETEIKSAQEQIAVATGVSPVGFRSPGYNISPSLLQKIRSMGFQYDSSVLPSPWGGSFRTISRYISGWNKATREGQFGATSHAKAPLWPYHPSERNFLFENPVRDDPFLEIPVSIDPLTRLPMTGTILMILGWRFFRGALCRLKKRGLPLTLVLHGIDFVDTDRYPPLQSSRGKLFFSGSLSQKSQRLNRLMAYLKQHFNLTTTENIINRERAIPRARS